MANYIDPLANAELQRTLAFARARETYPGLRGELLLEICEAAWERSAGDPSDGGALARFESALDLIARQYRIGGGRLSVSEVAQTAIPATALNPYMRAGAKRIAEDARAAENAAAVPVNPTFGDRLSRVPRLAPAPLGITIAASVFGVAAAAQAGVLPDTPITPSHHGASQSDSGASNGQAKRSGGGPAPIAPAATSPGPDSFLLASHAASQAAPGEWQAPEQEDGTATVAASRSSLAAPGAVSGPAGGVQEVAATPVADGGATAPVASVPVPVADVQSEAEAETPPAPKPSRPSITIDLNGGGVQVNTGKDDDDDQNQGDDDQQNQDEEQKPESKPAVNPGGLTGVVQVIDPATGQQGFAVQVNGVLQIIDGLTPGGSPGSGTPDGQDGHSTGTDDGSGEPVGVVDETTDDGTTAPIGDSTGDEETGDTTNEPPPTDDGTNEGQGTPTPTPTPTPDPTAAAHAAPATPAPATPAPATPAPATPAPATPAPATPAPATPAPATPAPATPAPATPAPATPPAAPATPAATTTPAPTPTPGA